jgi:Plavaka transposase
VIDGMTMILPFELLSVSFTIHHWQLSCKALNLQWQPLLSAASFLSGYYDLGPFIADYPEQVMLTGTVQGWCPKYVLCHYA